MDFIIEGVVYLLYLPIIPVEDQLTDLMGMFGSIYIGLILAPLWAALLLWLGVEIWRNRKRTLKRHLAKKSIIVIYALFFLSVSLPSWFKEPVSKTYLAKDVPELLKQFGELGDLSPNAEIIVSQEVFVHDFNTGGYTLPAEMMVSSDNKPFYWGVFPLNYLRVKQLFPDIKINKYALANNYPPTVILDNVQCLLGELHDVELRRKAGAATDSFRFEDFELTACDIALPYIRIGEQQFTLNAVEAQWYRNMETPNRIIIQAESEYWTQNKLWLESGSHRIKNVRLQLNSDYQVEMIEAISSCDFIEECFPIQCNVDNTCQDLPVQIPIGQCTYNNNVVIYLTDFKADIATWHFSTFDLNNPISESCQTQRLPYQLHLAQ